MENLSKLLVAQSHLMQAASDFFDACIRFRSDVSAHHPSPAPYPSQVAPEDILAKLHHTVDSIAFVESRIHNSRAVLNGVLNESVVRVPINNLPSEILSRIFAIAVSSTPCFLASGHRDIMLDIPLVCARWRQIAIDTRALWSHIDVRASSPTDSSIPSFNHLLIYMNRCHGMPIHIHLDTTCNIAEEYLITEFISTLQPRVAFLQSLTILGNKTAPWAQAPYTLCLSYDAPDMVKTLVISQDMSSRDMMAGEDPKIPFPTYPFQGLVHLELLGPRGESRALLGELSTTISNCPALHTLLLRNLWIVEEQQKHTHISLPSLRLLQMHNVYGEGVPLFLSMLHPGRLELDVSLGVDSFDSSELVSCVQSLLARSNVVSLAIGVTFLRHSVEFGCCISSVPCLRALIINTQGRGGPEILGDLFYDSVAQLPNLRSLCLVRGDMRAEGMDRVKQIVQSRNLHTLCFLSCRFIPPFDEQLQNEDDGEDNEDDNHDSVPLSYRDMPESMKEWLSERVERIIVGDIPPTRIHQGVDLFVQELI